MPTEKKNTFFNVASHVPDRGQFGHDGKEGGALGVQCMVLLVHFQRMPMTEAATTTTIFHLFCFSVQVQNSPIAGFDVL